MPRHPRTRRLAKWIGVFLTILLLAAWTISLQRSFRYYNKEGRWIFDVICGHLHFVSYSGTAQPESAESTWEVYKLQSVGELAYGFTLPRLESDTADSFACSEAYIPLWCPLLIVALPTGVIHFRDRNRLHPRKARRHPRLLRTAKVTATSCCALSLAAFMLSGWSSVSYATYWNPMRYATLTRIDVYDGACEVSCTIDKSRVPSLSTWGTSGLSIGKVRSWTPRWFIQTRLTPRFFSFSFDDGPGLQVDTYSASIPLYLPFLLFLLPTLLLWRRRRFPKSHCQSCGYNLTANTSGRCPECGKPTPAPAAP